ncbi:Mu transposase domain-containing protein [Streptomyces europaeiscabiei]|uniref:Mu transposase domain-containing protein n=1 Tax=Streptomyces europaeiscabiei TaxID=146819 RepID=UPI0029A90413|nr:hypothetical protein [Streptomyces europaeiscabiei]MDX3617328.1 hypothetical protein [Streptomyces europaeiscabiei]MDX3636162.1 hypothetical protein [Streptomyces europaeiscabiei]MDX3654260.1 hypothetical protein [Streptomyces europaeiscabiei]WUD30125.1 hypothetical protein OG858_00960 [Streptomyces europaeiscabiei]
MTFQPRVDRYSRVTVRMCSYSVPARFIDRKVAVHLTGDTLVVFEGRREIARHIRLTGRGLEHLVLDHYLEVLLRKPGALGRSEALYQAAPRAPSLPSTRHSGTWPSSSSARSTGRKPWSGSWSCTVISSTPT